MDGIVPYVVARHGTVDILVNNAIRCPIKSLVEMDQSEFDLVMQVNFRSAVVLSRKCITVMTGRKRGTILNILSTAGAKAPEVGGAYLSACAASKGAMAAFTLSTGAEVKPLGINLHRGLGRPHPYPGRGAGLQIIGGEAPYAL